ncbi:MAG: hypothetical protein ABSA46_03540, partial [Thermodesulfovibrionales bacterium]
IRRQVGSINRCVSLQEVNNTQLHGGSNYSGKVGPILIGGTRYASLISGKDALGDISRIS